ncbi:PAS domain-containing protein [bacterium]|nr:MAG: PAS domain-containing protein [bacterium]
MPKATPPIHSTRQYVDEHTYRSLVRISTAFEIIGLGVALTIQIFMPTAQLPLQYSIPAIALLAIGLIYNSFVWRGWHNKRPHLALQIAVLPPIISILIASIATGGINSDWYYLWLIAIVCSGIAGALGATVAAILTAIFWLYSALLIPNNMSLEENLFKMLATIIGLAAAYFIGLGVNRVIKTMRTAEDLTHQLDGAEMRTQLMMSSIADVVVAVDTARQIIIFNEAAQNITGWDQESAMGVDYNLIFKLKDQAGTELSDTTDPFLQALQTGQPVSTDKYYMLSKNNQKISFSIVIAPSFDSKGQTNGAIAIFHDISDQKAVARERNEFISTASHEMRTPVAAIEGYLAMAMNPSLATVDERAKTYIDKAHTASLHLGKLFRDLLSVTKIEDNRMAINRRRFNITELMNQVIGEMEIIAKTKNIKVSTHFDSGGLGRQKVIAPSYEVNADPDRLREVMANLIDNAIKYSKENTTIDVSLKPDKKIIVFSVTDMGIGITATEQKHLFQKFYRVNNSFTRDVGGTGLGLYIARNLIEQFGGKIWVESQEGKGSTFSFSLPLDTSRPV